MSLFTGVGLPENKKFKIFTKVNGKDIYLYYTIGIYSSAWVFDITDAYPSTSEYFLWTASRQEDISGRKSYYIHPVVDSKQYLQEDGTFTTYKDSAGSYATKEVNEDTGNKPVGFYRLLVRKISAWYCIRVGERSMISQFPVNNDSACDETDYIWKFTIV